MASKDTDRATRKRRPKRPHANVEIGKDDFPENEASRDAPYNDHGTAEMSHYAPLEGDLWIGTPSWKPSSVFFDPPLDNVLQPILVGLDFFVVRLLGITGRRFAMGRMLKPGQPPKAKKLLWDHYETRTTHNENAKTLKAIKKQINQFVDACDELDALFEANHFAIEWILPSFYCSKLNEIWPKFLIPFDLTVLRPNLRVSPGPNLLKALPCNQSQNDALSVEMLQLVSSLYSLSCNNGRDVMLTFNYSLLFRALKRLDFEAIPCHPYLYHLFGPHILQHMSKADADVLLGQMSQNLPPKPLHVEQHPSLEKNLECLGFATKLFPYQKQNVSWMMQVEEQSVQLLEQSIITITTPAGPFFLDAIASKLVIDQKSGVHQKIDYCGGLLADEMGLGKTVQTAALIAARPCSEEPTIWRTDQDIVLESIATLVIAPSHLVHMVWLKICREACPTWKIVILTTKRDFERAKVKDILHADIVVASVEFLFAKVHMHSEDALLDTATFDTRINFVPYFESLKQAALLLSDSRLLSMSCQPLYMYKWHRVVIDEAHEVLAKLSHGAQNPFINHLKANHYWFLTGTPFSNYGVVKQMSRMLNIFGDSNDPAVCFSRMQILSRHLTRKNTKQNVEHEIQIPEMQEHIVILDFTPTERGMYEAAFADGDTNHMRSLCCEARAVAPQNDQDNDEEVCSIKTLSEIETILIRNRQDSLALEKPALERKLKKIAKKEAKLELFLQQPPTPATPQILDAKLLKLENLRKLASNASDTISKLEREVGYFTAAMSVRDTLKYDPVRKEHTAVGPCPVCLDVVVAPSLTLCGHLFCHECIMVSRDAAPRCPSCRHPIASAKEVLRIAGPSGVVPTEDAMRLSAMVEKYGTKMGNLVHRLLDNWQNAPEEKIVIFASRTAELYRLREVFKNEQIKSVLCQGQVAVRNNAIAHFNDPASDVRVMLLSLEKAASGSNLIITSEIILLDTVWNANDSASRIATEWQAINRAHRVGQPKNVRIVRLLIRDTIEMERYLEQNPDVAIDPTQNIIVRPLRNQI